jgi:hypothetical protein
MAMMDNHSLPLRQPTGIIRPSNRMTFSARPMESLNNRQNFTFQLLVILTLMSYSFCFKTPNKQKYAIAGSGEQDACVTFCTSNGSFTLRQLWLYDIKNCQSATANFCAQYQPISWNVPGLMASISDQ